MKKVKISSLKDGAKFRFENSIIIWEVQTKEKGGKLCTATVSGITRIWKNDMKVIQLTDTHL